MKKHELLYKLIYMEKGKDIIIVGMGYVGLSLATLLARQHHILAIDIDRKKVDSINKRVCPFKDDLITSFFLDKGKDLNLVASTHLPHNDGNQPDYVIVAVPTDYDSASGHFDTDAVESVIEEAVGKYPETTIVIKSTVPVGFTKLLCEKWKSQTILFSPEFLRESQALKDNLYPSRIIVGADQNNEKSKEKAKEFASLLKEASFSKDSPIFLMGTCEAETVKLFSNTFLAMRVAFFNEMDSYALAKGLSAREIVDGVSADPRIGHFYNNPSFGFGGYCLPKDTKQLLADYNEVPQSLVAATIASNEKRKQFIAEQVYKLAASKEGGTPVIGVYRLAMKAGSDNFRSSAVFDVVAFLKNLGAEVIIFEPSLQEESYLGCPINNDWLSFVSCCDLILANRVDERVKTAPQKLFSRDLFQRD